jgi:hypothetical protein
MPSLVAELQADALNSKFALTDLLQKCLVVATKLGVSELADWARRELDGYGENPVPEYRIVYGDPQVFNPYHGYQPLHFGDPKHAEAFSSMQFNQPIGELEYDLRRAEKAGSGSFQIGYSQQAENMLMQAIKFRLRPSLHVSSSRFRRILDAVRKIVLEWSLKLESDGILGDGMTFSGEEQARAKEKSVTYHIKNYIHGTFDHSLVQVEAISSTQQVQTPEFDLAQITALIAALREALPRLALAETPSQELAADLQTLESQAQSPNPKRGIVHEALLSVRAVLENAGGSLLAAGLLQQIGRLFGS